MHTQTAYVPSGIPASKSSSSITFSFLWDYNAAIKPNDDPLMASRRWTRRPILYSSNLSVHTSEGGKTQEGHTSTQACACLTLKGDQSLNPSSSRACAEGKRRGDNVCRDRAAANLR